MICDYYFVPKPDVNLRTVSVFISMIWATYDVVQDKCDYFWRVISYLGASFTLVYIPLLKNIEKYLKRQYVQTVNIDGGVEASHTENPDVY